MSARNPQTRIGISGWRYAPWRGTFYPRDLKQKDELAFASRALNSIELNGSFYSLQFPKSYKSWHDATPDDFVFSIKCPRFITHLRRLRNIDEPLNTFLASGLLALKSKLGPFLWQLPPTFKFDPDVLESFFNTLPRDTKEAAARAKHHGPVLKHRAYTIVDQNRPLRHALEFRHDSFMTSAFVTLCRKHDIAMVIADAAHKFPYAEDVTADFVYCRLHGAEQLYASGYTDAELARWAEKVRAWQRGGQPKDAKRIAPVPKKQPKTRDVYVYFDNDAKVRAPFDAMNLAHRLGAPAPAVPDPEKPDVGEAPRLTWPPVRRAPKPKTKGSSP